MGEIEGTITAMRLIHVFVDNASYHKAGIVEEWLAAAGRKSSYALPSALLSPSRYHRNCLWALMHENVTHNRDYKTFAEFRKEIIPSLRYEVPRSLAPFLRPRCRTISA